MRNWSDEASLPAVIEWASSHVRITGHVEQTHIQPWSMVLRMPSSEGTVWFKSVRTGSEVALTEMLQDAVPEQAPELVASDRSRGWMLMRDAGRRLRELVESRQDLWRWEAFLPRYAELQMAVAPLADEFLRAGVPEQPLARLAADVSALLDESDLLMLGHPGGLSNHERRQLVASTDEIGSMAANLAALGIPETIQHDDLNDGNVFVRDGHARAMDWGDACVSHPFHSLTVLLRATAYRLDLEPGSADLLRLRDAYLEGFGGYATRSELVEAANVGYRTGTLARALAWRRYLGATPRREWGDQLESVPYGLRKFLRKEPIGAWR